VLSSHAAPMSPLPLPQHGGGSGGKLNELIAASSR
jgi:hypothetical protein